MADTKTSYLVKLLTLLVRRDGGTLRIPIGDLMVDDIGQGISVHFDQEKKELVLSYVPAGTTIYKIEGGVTWLQGNSLPLLNSQEPKRPLSQDELIARVWSESGATPTVEEVRHPQPKNKVVTLTSESMAEAELARAKARAVREIENYQSPQPPSRERQRVVFAKP